MSRDEVPGLPAVLDVMEYYSMFMSIRRRSFFVVDDSIMISVFESRFKITSKLYKEFWFPRDILMYGFGSYFWIAFEVWRYIVN